MRTDAQQPGDLTNAHLNGEGAILPGSYATTPTDNSYNYVAQADAPGQAGGGNVAALMAGSKWTGVDAGTQKTVITYSFADPQTSIYTYGDSSDFSASLTTFSEADRQTTRDVLDRIASVCNVEFVEVQDNATECGVLRYGYSQEPTALNFAGYAFFPSSSAIGGDIWIGSAQASAQWDFYKPDLLLHETLHAIGLKHPFDSGAVLSASQNIISNTVMSYSPVAGATSGYMSQYPAAPMAMDIAALQYLYGDNTSTNAGNTVYDLAGADFQTGFRSVWDASGSDTFDASGIAHGVQLDLADGAVSNVGAVVRASGTVNGATVYTNYTATVSIAAGAGIENAVGSAYADSLFGSDASNWMQGGAGNDSIEGRGGNDVIDGGDGRDTAIYAASRASASIDKGLNGITVATSATGADTLVNVERVAFSDAKVALDLAGNAGVVAKLIGAVFGADAVHNAQFVGIGLNLVDNGMSALAVAQLALDTRLGAHASNQAVVDLLYTHVTGAAPSAAVEAHYVALLDNGTFTQASLAQAASVSDANLAHIDFTGLAAHGLDYAG
ncbi:MAG: M10 family metallopeptidase C-terminal domain-containing protein [Pseudomonadota bacterium]